MASGMAQSVPPVPGATAPSAAELAIFVADTLSGTWLDRDWDESSVEGLLERAAETGGLPVEDLRTEVGLRILRDPDLLALPRSLAVEVQLRRLVALAPLAGISLWGIAEDGCCEVVASAGASDPDPNVSEKLALRVLSPDEAADGTPDVRDEDLLVAPVMRWQQPHGVLIARTRGQRRRTCRLFLDDAAGILGPVLERDALLRRSAEKERALVSAGERGLERLGLDLHDRPIQDAAALAGELRMFRDQLASVLESNPQARLILGRVDDVEARVAALHAQLREMSHSLVSPMLLKRPLGALLELEAAGFRAVSDLELSLDLQGDLDSLSVSQRVAILRIAQEALSNIRDHGDAHKIQITVSVCATHVDASIVDDGSGFDVPHAMADAARRGRLGLVGMIERARLLGGACAIRSCPGGPTRIEVHLPRWDEEAAAAASQGD